MTAQLVHDTHVDVDVSETGTRYWRAKCRCGWKSGRYTQHATAVTHEQRHRHVVAAGEWRQGGAA